MFVREKGGQTYSRARFLLSLLCIAFLTWRIGATTLADRSARSDPGTALWWDSAHPVALVNLAEQRRKAGSPADVAQAVQLAQRAIEVEPLAPNALALLGTVAAYQGDATKAEILLDIAANRAPRHLLPQGYLYGSALLRNDFGRAAAVLNAILRAHPTKVPEVSATVPNFLSHPGGPEELAQVLATDPPWRPWLLAELFRQWRNPDGLVRLVGILNEGPRPLQPEELSAYLSKLIEVGRLEEAYLSWLQQLPADRLSKLGFLYNGGFDYALSNLPFDWSMQPIRGAAVELARGAQGTVLRVGFSGARVPFRHVSHLLVLPPGHYRFVGSAKAERLQTERGLRWRVSCLEDPEASLGESDLIVGSTPWRQFQVDFSVPPSGCRAQKLLLELPARVALEQQISGLVSYAALDIQKRY